MGLSPFLSAGVLGLQSKAWGEGGFSLSPLGDIVPERHLHRTACVAVQCSEW